MAQQISARKVTGIIAEYNPFHNGHAYHIQKAKELSGADACIVAMSPDFVQRGEPAITDQHVRTRMALEGGADVVLQMPVCFAAGSAEYFAQGGVRILDLCGCVDTISFGCETPDTFLMWKAASVLRLEPPVYREVLKENLQNGLTFPAAREKAVTAALLQLSPNLSKYRKVRKEEIEALFRSPNNILALEYIKALQLRGSSMIPIAVPRVGSGYHDEAANRANGYASAGALRNMIYSETTEDLSRFIPDEPLKILSDAFDQHGSWSEALYDRFVRARCLQEEGRNGWEDYLDIDEALANRLREKTAFLPDTPPGTENLVALLQTKDVTKGRVRRALLHLLLDIRTDETNQLRSDDSFAYARVLGFRREASWILREISDNGRLKLITKPADAKNILHGPALDSFEQDVRASHLYRLLQTGGQAPASGSCLNEYRTGPVILSF